MTPMTGSGVRCEYPRVRCIFLLGCIYDCSIIYFCIYVICYWSPPKREELEAMFSLIFIHSSGDTMLCLLSFS